MFYARIEDKDAWKQKTQEHKTKEQKCLKGGQKRYRRLIWWIVEGQHRQHDVAKSNPSYME